MKKFAALCLMMPLMACGFGHAAPTRYGLTPDVEAGTQCRQPVAIKVNQLSAAPGLDSRRIAVIDRPNHRTFYRGVAWSAAPGYLVQHYLADYLEQAGRFENISTDLDTVPADYRIEGNVRAFQVDQTHQRMEIRLTLALVREADGRLVKTLKLRRTADVAGENMAQIAEQFNTEMNAIAAQVVQQIGRSIPACR